MSSVSKRTRLILSLASEWLYHAELLTKLMTEGERETKPVPANPWTVVVEGAVAIVKHPKTDEDHALTCRLRDRSWFGVQLAFLAIVTAIYVQCRMAPLYTVVHERSGVMCSWKLGVLDNRYLYPGDKGVQNIWKSFKAGRGIIIYTIAFWFIAS